MAPVERFQKSSQWRALPAFVALSVVGCAGEPRRLPPREAPAHDVPSVALPQSALQPRTGRVVLEATDGPMRVIAKYDPSFIPPGGPVEHGRSGELCVTPCVVDLPIGKYRLFLSATENIDAAAGDTDDLVVGEGLQVYRRAPGRYRTPSPTDALAPGAALVVSLLAVATGTVLMAKEDSRGAATGLVVGGLVGGTLSGFWAYDKSRATQQDGATSTWRVGP